MANSKITFDLVADTTKYVTGIDTAEVSTGKLVTGLGLLAAGGGILAALGTTAYDVGTQFEDGFAKVSTLFGDVEVDTTGLENKMLDLQSASGLTSQEISEGLYSALSAGIPVTEDMAGAMEFLEGSSELARGGFTSLDSAVDVTTSVLNAYGMEASDAAKIQDILITTQNKGKTTVDELASSISQVTPTAAAMGVSFEDVAAGLATMTAQGTPTAQATTQMNSLLAELGKEGTAASETFKELSGQTFTDFIASGGNLGQAVTIMSKGVEGLGGKVAAAAEELPRLEDGSLDTAGAIDEVLASTDGADQSLIDMFGSIEAGKAAMQLAAEDGANFAGNLDAVTNSSGATSEAAEKMETTTFQTSRIWEGFNVALTKMANKILPVINPALEWLADNMDWLGPIILKVVAAFGALLIVLGTIFIISATGSAIIAGLGAAFAFLTSPITLLVAAIAGLVIYFVLLYNKSEEFRTKINEIVDNIKETFLPIWENLKTQVTDAFATLGSALSEFFALFSSEGSSAEGQAVALGVVFNILAGIVTAAFGIISGIVEGFVDTISGIVTVITGIINGDWAQVWEGAKLILLAPFQVIDNILTSIFGDAFIKAKEAAVEKLNELVAWIKGLPAKISTAFSSAKDAIVKPFANAYTSIVNWLNKMYNKVVSVKDSIVGAFSNLVTGISAGIQNGIDGLIANVKNLVNNWLISPVNSALGVLNKIPGVSIGDIPFLAKGGVVDGATLAMIGEAGPEAVVPLNNRGASFFEGLFENMDFGNNGNGSDQNITVNLAGDLAALIDKVDVMLGGRTV